MADINVPEDIESISNSDTFVRRSQRKRKWNEVEAGCIKNTNKKVSLPKSQSIYRVRKVPRKKELNQNDNSEKCSICEQDNAEVLIYNGHPQYAVEEIEAIQDERILTDGGRTSERQCINITGFSVYDENGHLCPIVPNRVGKNIRVYISGYLKSTCSESAVIDENSIPVKDVGPFIHWFIRFNRCSLKLGITLCTEFADYHLLTPSVEYTPLMNNFHEKWCILNVILIFLRQSINNIQPTYEELLKFIKNHTIPGIQKQLPEEILRKHAQFICDQVVNLENEQYLITVHCLAELMRYCNSKLVAENVNKSVRKKIACTKATTTPLVRCTFGNLFPHQLDEINRQRYLGRKACLVCVICQKPDCGQCSVCRAMPKFGGSGRSKKICIRKICPYVRNQHAEESDSEGEPNYLPNDAAVKVTRDKKIIWIGEPVQVDAKETYYEKVKIDGVEFSVGDYVTIKTLYPGDAALVGRMTYIWKDNTTKIGYFHTELFRRAASTVVGEVGDVRELFLGNRCHHGVQLSSVIGKACVERRDQPQDWSRLGGKETQKEVNRDDGKTYFYQKYYDKFTARFEDPPVDLKCPNPVRKHRYCPTCERKIRSHINIFPIALERILDSEIQEVLRTEYRMVQWEGNEYKKGCAVFINPRILTFKKPEQNYTTKTKLSRSMKMRCTKRKDYNKSKTIRLRKIKKRETKIENIDENKFPNDYRKKDNNWHDLKNTSEIKNTRSRTIQERKCKIKIGRENNCPEAYRKNDNNLHDLKKTSKIKNTRSRNIKERKCKIKKGDENNFPDEYRKNDKNLDDRKKASKIKNTRSRNIKERKCKIKKGDENKYPDDYRKNDSNLHDFKKTSEIKNKRSRNIKERKCKIKKGKENNCPEAYRKNDNNLHDLKKTSEIKNSRSRNIKERKCKIKKGKENNCPEAYRKNDNNLHDLKKTSEIKNKRSRNIKERKCKIKKGKENNCPEAYTKNDNNLHDLKKTSEIKNSRSRNIKERKCKIKKSNENKHPDDYRKNENNLHDLKKSSENSEIKHTQSQNIKERKCKIKKDENKEKQYPDAYRKNDNNLNDLIKTSEIENTGSRNIKERKCKIKKGDENKENKHPEDYRKNGNNLNGLNKTSEIESTQSRNIKDRKCKIKKDDENKENKHPEAYRKDDNNFNYLKKPSEIKNIQSRNIKKTKRKVEKVDETIYPEYYRKNDILSDLNVIRRRPFCVGHIVAVVVARDGALVSPDDIFLRVRVMFRPENTIMRFPQGADLNIVYWSEEVVEIPFMFVEGLCRLVYVDNIPRQTSIHEWLEEDPSRIYFRQSYNRAGRFEEVLEHAKQVGREYREMSKGSGKCCSSDKIAENEEVHVRPLRTLDVFAGCGGLSEGLHRAGVAECKWAIENQPAEALAYSLNNKQCTVFNEDCNTLLQAALRGDTHSEQGLRMPRPGEVELMCGGPPCQGFSGMNRYNARDCSVFKNSLVATLLSYCDYYRPDYFLLENVRNFVAFKKGIVLKLTVQSLLDMGYQCAFGVLQAGNYGVPQARRRVFVLAAAPGCRLPVFPEPSTTFSRRPGSLAVTIDKKRFWNNVQWRGSAPRRTCTVYDAISDLPPICNGADDIEIDYGSKPKTHFQRSVRSRDETVKLRNHITKKVSPLCHARICHIPTKPGSDWRDLPNIEVELSDGTKCKVLQYRYEVNKPQKRPRRLVVGGRAWRKKQAQRKRYGRARPAPRGRPRGGVRRGKSVVRRAVCACALGGACSPADKQDNTLIPWGMAHTADRHNNWAGLYGRNSWPGYFSTLVTNPEPSGKQGRVLHPTQHRVLSVREYARAQGFPDSHHFAGTIQQKYRQIGNAVPPPLAKAIGIEIKKAIRAQKSETAPVKPLITFVNYN